MRRLGCYLMLSIVLLSAIVLATPLFAAPVQVHRMDFEMDTAGRLPVECRSGRSLSVGYRIVASPQAAHAGGLGLELSLDRWIGSGIQYGYATFRIPAGALRGQRIRISAWGRFEQLEGINDGEGLIWLQSRRNNGLPGPMIDSGTPIARSAWVHTIASMNVPDDTDSLSFGAQITGRGRFLVDDFVVESLGRAGAGDLPPRPLTTQGATNLRALGELAALVHFFHPSDTAAGTDWLRFLIDSVDDVESAPNPKELAARLTRRFAGVAAGVNLTDRRRLPKSAPPVPPSGARFRIAWEHHGYSASAAAAGTYWNRRVRVPVDSTGGVAPLGTAWEGRLAGGIRVRVPLVLTADSTRTLPVADMSVLSPADHRPVGWFPSGDDRSTRLADVLYAVGVLNHFFPYAEVVNLDLGTATEVALREAAIAQNSAAFTPVLEHLSSTLRDGHGWVTAIAGRASTALPIQLEFVEDELAVVAVDSTAGSIRVGDVVTRVGIAPVAEAIAEMSRRVSAATPGYLRSRVATRLGLSDTAITMGFRAADGTEYSRTLQPMAGPAPQLDKPARIAKLRPGVWYVDIDRITDPDWIAALDSLVTAKGIVYDLRGYPRGSVRPLEAMVRDSVLSPRWNIPILKRPYYETVEWDSTARWSVRASASHLDARVAFITDGRAISYAETWLALAEAAQLGPIVGEPTAGTNGSITTIPLAGGYSMSFTGMKVLRNDGSQHHGVGIHPAVPVHRTLSGIRAGRDEALERALELVSREH